MQLLITTQSRAEKAERFQYILNPADRLLAEEALARPSTGLASGRACSTLRENKNRDLVEVPLDNAAPRLAQSVTF